MLNTAGIIGFLASKILPIILAVIGVIIVSRAGKGHWSQAITTSGIAVLGLTFIGGATLLLAFGEKLARLAFGGG